jgi:xanthine dehydrogenase molybdopterin-binding subunit B
MVHGFPRTSLMWRFLAPNLAENHTVICVDLRAYGRSGIPASTDDHFPYSKRAIATIRDALDLSVVRMTMFEHRARYGIDPSGTVTLNIIRAEMGQHVGTALARIVADELEADWNKVKTVTRWTRIQNGN